MTRDDSSAAIRCRFVAVVEPVAQRLRRAQQRPAPRNAASTSGCRSRREVQKVRRRGIDGARRSRVARERAYCARRRPSRRRRRPQLEPWRHAREQTAEGLEMRDGPAVGARRLLDRHPRLERALGQIARAPDRPAAAPHLTSTPDRSGETRDAAGRAQARHHRKHTSGCRCLQKVASVHRASAWSAMDHPSDEPAVRADGHVDCVASRNRACGRVESAIAVAVTDQHHLPVTRSKERERQRHRLRSVLTVDRADVPDIPCPPGDDDRASWFTGQRPRLVPRRGHILQKLFRRIGKGSVRFDAVGEVLHA